MTILTNTTFAILIALAVLAGWILRGIAYDAKNDRRGLRDSGHGHFDLWVNREGEKIFSAGAYSSIHNDVALVKAIGGLLSQEKELRIIVLASIHECLSKDNEARKEVLATIDRLITETEQNEE